MGYIYKIQNKINNKIYIGKTTNTIHERWLEHIDESRRGDDSLLHKAIRKYGPTNFYVDCIEDCSCDILNDREKYYISIFHSHMDNGGYNMTLGGEGALRYSDEEIISLWSQGLRAGEIARTLGANPNTISQRLKFLIEDKAARQRYFAFRKKAVIQYSLEGELIKVWNSASDAEKALGLCSGRISKCCNKKAFTSGGYFWKFVEDDTPIEELQENYAISPSCCSVNLIDKDGLILKTYSSGREAEIALNLPRGKVCEVCNGNRPHISNYRFEWAYSVKRRIINERTK